MKLILGLTHAITAFPEKEQQQIKRHAGELLMSAKNQIPGVRSCPRFQVENCAAARILHPPRCPRPLSAEAILQPGLKHSATLFKTNKSRCNHD